MPTIIHLSDLHFGPLHTTHLDDLILNDIAALNPDVVIVSGDFTLRARHGEFEQARGFLARIPQPTLTIPGNHDQPIFNPIERLTRPYARYQKYVRADIDSTLTTHDIFVLGLNDNHPILPGGFWTRRQRQWIEQQFARAPRDAVKVVVTHHQLAWEGMPRPAGFWYPMRTLEFLARHGVELVLNGHTHVPGIMHTPTGVVVARAGTTSSTRTRHGNANAYNLITVDDKQISIFVRLYDARADAFITERAFTFARPPRHA